MFTPPQLPKISKSFNSLINSDMKGFLNRSLSFNSLGLARSYSSMEDEQNIFCADLVTTYFIIDKLMEVKKKTEVIKMEIEDLLISSHHSVLPIIKSLVITGKRQWQWIRFVDSVESDNFDVWQQKQRVIIQDYEATIDDSSKFKNIVSFVATVQIEVGTPYYVFRNILQSLQQDKYLSKLSLEWVQLGMVKKLEPSDISQIIDSVSGEMTEDISLSVVSGWSYNSTSSMDWKTILDVYIEELQPLVRDVIHPKPHSLLIDGTSTHERRLRRNKSSRALTTESKPSMRRNKSSEGNVRRVKTDGSMQLGAVPDPMPPQRNAQWNMTDRRPVRVKSIEDIPFGPGPSRRGRSTREGAQNNKSPLRRNKSVDGAQPTEPPIRRNKTATDLTCRPILRKQKASRSLSPSPLGDSNHSRRRDGRSRSPLRNPGSLRSLNAREENQGLMRARSNRSLSPSPLGDSTHSCRRPGRSLSPKKQRSLRSLNAREDQALMTALSGSVPVKADTHGLDRPSSHAVPACTDATSKGCDIPYYDWSIGVYVEGRDLGTRASKAA